MTKPTPERIQRDGHLRWVNVSAIKVNEEAQRALNGAWVKHIVAEFDPEQLGHPVLSHRDGVYYVIDGQHRVEAVRQVWPDDQQIQCWVHEALDVPDEADRFLKLNDRLTVAPIYSFKTAVTAGRPMESDIDRVVRALGLHVAKSGERSVGCVASLRRIYKRSGAKGLSKTLHVARDAWGDEGMAAPVLDGLSLVCDRYDVPLDEMIERLLRVPLSQLMSSAEANHKTVGGYKANSVAASIVDVLNRGMTGKKRLTSWWKL